MPLTGTYVSEEEHLVAQNADIEYRVLVRDKPPDIGVVHSGFAYRAKSKCGDPAASHGSPQLRAFMLRDFGSDRNPEFEDLGVMHEQLLQDPRYFHGCVILLGSQQVTMELTRLHGLLVREPHSSTTLTGCHNECNIDVDVGFSDNPRRQMETVEFRIADNNRDANRNPGKRPAVDDLTEESRRRIDSIVAQVDTEMERRAQMLARERYWGWLPNLLRDWVVGERVPTPRYKGDTSEGPRLPALGMPMERAFAVTPPIFN
ncbi:hypothetical protein E3N88_43125 [Mikania micrantha]|uniref:Uncharacterized protein n=1 Tax=Mikania micrantha TaxID=192012 RepID=A0A5N6LI06_9ASTR|nr:hypothetical protein E3N88_43125 [Mikania micrantha]